MKTAIVVSGVVRNFFESSNSWFFDGDYFLIADEYLYNRRSLKSNGILINKLSGIIKKNKIKFTSITIPSRNNIILKNETYYDPILYMLWKWKCAYHLIEPYNKINKYDKILIIRPDIFIKNGSNYDILNNMVVEKNTIHTMENIHTSIIDGQEKNWMNDMFLLFDINTFKKISLLYDEYVKNFVSTDDGEPNIHFFLAKTLENLSIKVKGGLIKFFDFIVLNKEVVNLMFENGELKNEYNYNDVVKFLNKI